MHALRLAFRRFLKKPGFAAATLLTLALGIGANTAIFSTIHAILLRPLPYPDQGRIMFVSAAERDRPDQTFPVNFADLEDWREQNDVFEQLGGSLDAQFVVTGDFESTRLKGAYVTPSTLDLLQVPPRLGRLLRAEEDRPGAARVCVLTHRAWERFFQARPDAIGGTVMLDGQPHEVVGVMPPGFKFWDAWFYVPLAHAIPPELRPLRGVRLGLWGIGRTRAGVTPQQAEAALDVIARRLEQKFPAENRKTTARVNPLAETVGGQLRPTLLLLFGAVAAVLLIACVNVANLLLARGAVRAREFAVRSALGAGHARLVRDLLIEMLPLGIGSAAAGILLASVGLRALLALIPAELIPAEAEIGLSWPVLTYSLVIGIGTALLAGMLPAWQAARTAVGESLKDGGRTGTGFAGTRVRSGLIVTEVALAILLLVGAGLLLRNLARLARTDPGFRTEHLLVAAIELPEKKYADPNQGLAFGRDLLDRVRSFALEQQAGLLTSLPLFNGSFNLPLLIQGQAFDRENVRSVTYNAITPGKLETLGIPLLRGRHLTPADRAGGENVVLLNATAARQFFGEQDPVGRFVACGIPPEMAGENPSGIVKALVNPPWARIIGVVADTRQSGLAIPPQPEVFFPFEQSLPVPPTRNSLTLVLRTSGDPRALTGSVRQEIRSLDASLPVDRIKTMEAVVTDTLKGQRFVVVLLGVFAGVALLLAAVGIYSVVAWLVSQRVREMGIRMALGAAPARVVRLMVVQGLRPVLIGLVLGTGLALGLSRVIAGQLVNVSPLDPITYAAVAVILSAVATGACWLPARRAARVNPTEALRAE